MTTGYYCAIFPFCGGGKKKKDDKKTKASYDCATTGVPVINGKKEGSLYNPLLGITFHYPAVKFAVLSDRNNLLTGKGRT